MSVCEVGASGVCHMLSKQFQYAEVCGCKNKHTIKCENIRFPRDLDHVMLLWNFFT